MYFNQRVYSFYRSSPKFSCNLNSLVSASFVYKQKRERARPAIFVSIHRLGNKNLQRERERDFIRLPGFLLAQNRGVQTWRIRRQRDCNSRNVQFFGSANAKCDFTSKILNLPGFLFIETNT